MNLNIYFLDLENKTKYIKTNEYIACVIIEDFG